MKLQTLKVLRALQERPLTPHMWRSDWYEPLQ